LLNKSDDIISFTDNAVADKDLPLIRIKDSRVALRKKGEESELKCFDTWADHALEAFSDVQWQIIEPFFALSDRKEARHNKTDDSVVPPLEAHEEIITSTEPLESRQKADIMSQFSSDPAGVREGLKDPAYDLPEFRSVENTLVHKRYASVKALIMYWEESDELDKCREEAVELQTLFHNLRYDAELYQIPVHDSHNELQAFILRHCVEWSNLIYKREHGEPHLLIIHYCGHGDEYYDKYAMIRSQQRRAVWRR
jgi:hypothetical protein